MGKINRKERNRLEKNDKHITGQKPQKPPFHHNCIDLGIAPGAQKGHACFPDFKGLNLRGEPSASVLSDGGRGQRTYFLSMSPGCLGGSPVPSLKVPKTLLLLGEKGRRE